MAEPTEQSVLERVMLGMFVGTAVAGFAQSYETSPAWVLLLPCTAALFFRLKRVSPRLQAWARYVAWGTLGGTAILGIIFMAYPVLSERATTRLALLAGYSLAAFSTLFFLGSAVWPPASTLFPATLGTLVVACFNRAAALRGIVALAAAAIFSYLALRGLERRARLRREFLDLRRLAWLAFSALGTWLVAWAIIAFLPWAQLRVEQATMRLFLTSSTHYSSLSLDASLGDLEQLKLSEKVVMRVWSSRPQKLRGRVFTQFDGQVWHARELATNTLAPVSSVFFPGRDLDEWLGMIPGTAFLIPGHTAEQAAANDAVRTKVVQTIFNNGMVLSPGEKLLVRVPVASLGMDAFQGLIPPMSSAIEIYGVINRRQGDIVQTSESSPQIISGCLTLPKDTDPRLKELAARLSLGTSSPEERIRRTLSYVQSTCRYSLAVGKFHSRQPVAEFLFEKKQGYCEYFATATAVLLRLEGIACRYVTGFNIQEGNRQGGHYVVREADAHAWLEAYLPGQGWLELDPTPEAEYQALHAGLRGGWWENTTEWLKTEVDELYIRVRGGDWLAGFRWLWGQCKALLRWLWVENFGASMCFLALVLLLYGWVRRRRRLAVSGAELRRAGKGAAPAPRELAELLLDLDRLWARRGFVRPASHAPLEHLASIPPNKISPELREASRKVIGCFYRCCFGGVRVMPGEIQELRRSVERTR